MNKLLLLFISIFFLIGPTASTAQTLSIDKITRFGLSQTAIHSRIRNIHNASIGRYGTAIGVFAQIKIEPRKKVYPIALKPAQIFFVAQLEYSMQGERTKLKDGTINKYFNDYINLPLYIKYYFSFKSTSPVKRFMIMGGPKIGGCVVQYGQADLSKERESVQLAHTNFKALDLGYSFAMGLYFFRHIEGFMRFDQSFTEVYGNYNRKTFNYALSGGINIFFD
ncbi:MAG: outer membrane beta-barrel protein [Brumimicrobium sp.]|nr:outer membrane beta-barrel protein [Brumimicrobium sp.]MCO5268214.1 PorT family protein [Brumimicrobium sp.]